MCMQSRQLCSDDDDIWSMGSTKQQVPSQKPTLLELSADQAPAVHCSSLPSKWYLSSTECNGISILTDL